MKYPRTFHVNFSPGATSDDKILKDHRYLIDVPLIITDKLDGSNVCFTRKECFARSHAGSPTHKSFDLAKAFHNTIKYNIPEHINIYVEYLYAKHSIYYDKLKSYFNIINIYDQETDRWLSWEEVQSWAEKLYIPTVPVLFHGSFSKEEDLEITITSLMKQPTNYSDIREGVVIRLQDSFYNKYFPIYVAKYVRKYHIQTNIHWKKQEIVKNLLAKGASNF